MEKTHGQSKLVTILLALLISWFVTMISLLLLAFLMLKFQLEEGKITLAVTGVYLLSTFCGGRIAGNAAETKKYLWGLLIGIFYFIVLSLMTLLLKKTIDPYTGKLAAVFCICVGGGMLGGMFSRGA